MARKRKANPNQPSLPGLRMRGSAEGERVKVGAYRRRPTVKAYTRRKAKRRK